MRAGGPPAAADLKKRRENGVKKGEIWIAFWHPSAADPPRVTGSFPKHLQCV